MMAEAFLGGAARLGHFIHRDRVGGGRLGWGAWLDGLDMIGACVICKTGMI
jgi:hypothetical protein